MRTARHAKILEIITHKEIETQEELCEELNRLNYVVTQATISRDIKKLNLIKVPAITKKVKYVKGVLIEEIPEKFKNLFKQ